MSLFVSNSFINAYNADVHQIFQRQGSMLLNAVRTQFDVVGSVAYFQKVGKGVATTKSRHGDVTPMNQSHTALSCTLADFYAPDFVDRLDLPKLNIDERMVIAQGGAAALGRKIDDQITTILTSTSQTVVTVTVTSKAAVRAGVLNAVAALYANDVPNDGQVYGAVTPKLWAQMSQIAEFASSDFVGPNGLPFTEGAPIGRWKDWMGIKWMMHAGLPGVGTASAEAYIWHKTALAYAAGKDAANVAGAGMVSAQIDWVATKAAWLINHWMSGQACLLDDTGIIQYTSDDTATVATS